MDLKVYVQTAPKIRPEIFLKINKTVKLVIKCRSVEQMYELIETLRIVQVVIGHIIICNSPFIGKKILKKKIKEKLSMPIRPNLYVIAKIIHKHIHKYEGNYEKIVNELSPFELTEEESRSVIEMLIKYF